MLSLKVAKRSFGLIRSYYGNKRIGRRDIVGHGCNGSYVYKDDAHFPFPAIRFKENTLEYGALRLKELGDWKLMTCEDKKALYRASFCQTFAEFQSPTGQWMFCLGWALILVSAGIWLMIFYELYVRDTRPKSFDPLSRSSQLRRMIDLHVNPIDGLTSNWDYLRDTWKT